MSRLITAVSAIVPGTQLCVLGFASTTHVVVAAQFCGMQWGCGAWMVMPVKRQRVSYLTFGALNTCKKVLRILVKHARLQNADSAAIAGTGRNAGERSTSDHSSCIRTGETADAG